MRRLKVIDFGVKQSRVTAKDENIPRLVESFYHEIFLFNTLKVIVDRIVNLFK